MAIKLIASDIDGTIIDDFGNISQDTRRAIHKLKDYGIRFTFATGRSYESTLRIAQQLGVDNEDVGMICLNGLQTFTLPSQDLVEKETLSFEESVTMQRLGERYYLGIMYCFDDVIYFQMDDLSYKDYMIAMGDDAKRFFNRNLDVIPVNSVHDIKERFETDRIQKIAYIQSPQYMDLIVDRIRKDAGIGYEFMRVGPGWTEVGIDGVSKGNAVVEYAARYGIKPEEIMVFGDSENDISMFKIAKKAVAVENAMDSAKAHATHFTKSNEDHGVAVFIEEYLKSLE